MECSIYGKRGEAVATYIIKGAQIGISGEALLRTWEAKDGSKGTTLECRVHDVTLLGAKTTSNIDDSMDRMGATPASHQSVPHVPIASNFDDFSVDIPF